MAATFFYNGESIFTGMAYPPKMEREVDSVYVNGRKCIVDRVILRGRIIEVCKIEGLWIWIDDLEDPIVTELGDYILFGEGSNLWENSMSIAREIINKFRENFKKFEVVDNGQIILSMPYAIVRSINFEQSKWTGLTPFEVVIESYRQEFAEVYGVLDPSLQYNYQQNENKTVTYTATVSARGINDSKQALTNALNFVNSFNLEPEFATVSPEFTDYAGYFTFLRQRRVDIDRLSGTVTRTEVYEYNESGIMSDFPEGVLEFQTQLNKNEQGVYEVSITGSLTGDEAKSNVLNMVNSVKAYNWFSIANDVASKETANLLSTPLEFSSTINNTEKKVEFSITYSTNSNSSVYRVDSTTISRDFEENKTCITASLTFKKEFGCSKARWQDILNNYKSFDFKQYIQQKWNKYVDSSTINSNFINQSYSENEFDGELQISATYCSDGTETCGCVSNFDYTTSWDFPVNQYIQKDTYGGDGVYYVENTNSIPRAQFQLQGSATPNICCSFNEVVSEIKSRINILVNRYFPGRDKVLQAVDITENEQSGSISFSTSLHSEQDEFLIEVPFPEITGITPGDGRSMIFSAREGVMTDNDLVSVHTWTDLSGNNFHATQGTTASKPKLIIDPVSGENLLSFDGVNDFFSISSGLGLLANRPYVYVIANFSHFSSNVFRTLLNITTSSPTTVRTNLWVTDANFIASSFRTNVTEMGSVNSVADSAVRQGQNVVFARHLFASGISTIQVNLNNPQFKSYQISNTANINSAQIRIGNQNGVNHFQGNVACLAVVCPPNPLTHNEEVALKQWAAFHTRLNSA